MNNTITLPQTLIKRLEKITAGSRRTPDAIVRQAVKNQIEYEEWKLEQIDAGLAELKAGKGIPNDEFWAKIGAVKNARKKAAWMVAQVTAEYRTNPNAVHLTVRGELVEPPATQPKPFDKLRANGFFKWTALGSIRDYIAVDNPVAAQSVLGEIRRVAESLRNFPMMGHAGERVGTRDLVLSKYPYTLIQ